MSHGEETGKPKQAWENWKTTNGPLWDLLRGRSSNTDNVAIMNSIAEDFKTFPAEELVVSLPKTPGNPQASWQDSKGRNGESPITSFKVLNEKYVLIKHPPGQLSSGRNTYSIQYKDRLLGRLQEQEKTLPESDANKLDDAKKALES